ncbi:3-oxo-5-alpha-steroid 4-dehydrogenase-domain-containing protein [Epithele typhae]|uniref:3-oxo-5-alpha-steroid 4-dehydrogenase-domain-containing protein n=1 Tax=Epithele typhae TaxID=378194 RepID=UPI002007213E|nr:3-oxo-5-alpha-steroid 4-dehydrogenase-domain-containing protein [Epithele typhae]KAH9942181.1 3-oxo-5-alpha-steroid 4-dehydrogenase-domain-containing protein [Epithele typhae]
MLNIQQAKSLYDATKYWFTVLPPFMSIANFAIDAPFGRFALTSKSIFELDGIRSWIFMELVSIVALSNAYLRSPLNSASFGSPPSLSLSHPPTLLAGLYVIHYINRGLLSPLRTPSRSKSHVLVAALAIAFNSCNGSLMGAYLSSPGAQTFLADAYARPLFWFGLALWALGFAGNIAHDEILLNLRRRHKAAKKDDDDADGSKPKQEHYAIPHGGLYRFVSFPNYLCEWMEWVGFALAAAPPPSVAGVGAYVATLLPPWLFVVNEVLFMFPRAFKGHRWYHSRFPDYPRSARS